MNPRTPREFEAAARARLEPAHYDHFAGGAGDEVTVRANEAAFEPDLSDFGPQWVRPC